MTDFSKSLVRCSSIGLIMSDGMGQTPYQEWEYAKNKLADEEAKYEALDEKKKAQKPAEKQKIRIEALKEKIIQLDLHKNDEVLSEGCKTYLTRLYAYEKYGKWSASKDVGNKYTIKGKLVEEDSIDLLCQLEQKMMRKNEERIQNEFICGIPDIFEGESIYKADYVTDIKSSWDVETFFANLGKPLKGIYWWQLQGYLALTGAKQGEVSYCLVNTPDSILNDEKYRLFRRMNCVTEADPNYLFAEIDLVNNLTFDDMPKSHRRIKFPVERDDAAIEKIYKKVAKCREWLFEIEKLHLETPTIGINELSLQEIDV